MAHTRTILSEPRVQTRRDDVLIEVACWKRIQESECLGRIKPVLGSQTPTTLSESSIDLISSLLQSPNSVAAILTFAGLRSSNLDETWLHDLCLNVARPRTGAKEGRRGILSCRQALQIGEVLEQLSDIDTGRLNKLLNQCARGGQFESDPILERGLILKALAVSRQRKKIHWSKIELFAEAIRGRDRYTLVRSISLVCLDNRSTSNLAKSALRSGHLQGGESFCSLTASMVILQGELDPIYSLQVHQSAQAHAGELKDDARLAQGGAREHAILRQAAWRAVTEGRLSQNQCQRLLCYARNAHIAEDPEVLAALNTLKAMGLSLDRDSIDRLRATDPRVHAVALDIDESLTRVQKSLGLLMKGKFRVHEVNSPQDFGKLKRALLKASDLGGCLCGNSHYWWPIVDVLPSGNGCRFLIHDAFSEQTAWVEDTRLVDGSFCSHHFQWPEAVVADKMILPTLVRKRTSTSDKQKNQVATA
jgi:hypothetical protein